MAGGRLDFGFQFSTTGAAARRSSDDQPMRILVLADLRGSAERTVSLAARTPLAIDLDNAERVLARLAPSLSLTLEGEQEPVELVFEKIDDFHPDALFRRSGIFAGLRALREELNSQAGFARAAAALGLGGATATTVAPESGPTESNADMIERLLGRAPAKPVSAPPQVVDRLLHEAVAPHIVQDDTAARTQATTLLDAMIADRMRRILHQPAFQRLEAAWHGVWKLATELETGETLKISLLDITREELAADLQNHAEDLSASALHSVLSGPETVGEEGMPWSLLVGDFTFGPEDTAMLAALGALAGRAGAPFLAGASPALVGCANLLEPGSLASLGGEAGAAWQALRQSPLARWIGLALPRLLVRLPYGAATDPVESFAFEELAGDRGHEDYLWGSPAYALAFLAAQAYGEEGWEMDVAARLVIEDLPSHVYRNEDGEAEQQACAEVWLSETVAEAILDRGVMPILSYRNRNAARLLRWQSVSMPSKALAGIVAG